MENETCYSVFDNRIKRIKNTIDDIRLNLEELKNENLASSHRSYSKEEQELTFKSKNPQLKHTFTPTRTHYIHTEASGKVTLDDLLKTDPNHMKIKLSPHYSPFKTSVNKNKVEEKPPLYKANHKQTSPLRLNYTYHKYNMTDAAEQDKRFKTEISESQNNLDNNQKISERIKDYELQIAELKVKINELQQCNTIMQTQISEQAQALNKIKLYEETPVKLTAASHPTPVNLSNEEILQELQSFYGGVRKEDLIRICRKQTERLIKMNHQEDFISKLRKLYISLNDCKEGEKISLKTLWRWIKNVIKFLSSQNKVLLTEKTAMEYQSICEQLIKEYNLRSMEELKGFINELLSKNEKNKLRVNKMKKILLTNPNETKNFSTVNTQNY